MVLTLLGAITGLLFLLYFQLVNGGRFVPSASNWFVLINGLLLVGTLQVLDASDGVAIRFAFHQVFGLAAFVLGAWFVNLLLRTNPSRRIGAFIDRPLVFDLQGLPWVSVGVPLLVIALLVCAGFALALGYHVVLDQIALARTSVVGDELLRAYSSLRTEVHYGGRYLYIGYVTQFRDFILPTITAFYVVRAQQLGGRGRWAALVLLLLANVYFLTITGQRRPVLVFAVVLFLVASSPWAVVRGQFKGRRALPLVVGLVGVAAVSLFIWVAAVRSRGTSSGPVGLLLDGLQELWGRVGPELATAKIALAQLLADRPVSWGADWLASLATVLPGHEGGLATSFHALLYGSERGAAGLMVWESLWMNFGWVGILCGGLLCGVVLQGATLWMWRGPRYASKHAVLLYFSLQLGLVTGPYFLFGGGVLALGLLYALYSVARRSGVTVGLAGVAAGSAAEPRTAASG